jgi:metal-responsive CopG/Arc/MetJ family transcriptional regulator
MVVSKAFADRLDAFRAGEPGVPNRSEAIRILVNEALAAREVKGRDNGKH